MSKYHSRKVIFDGIQFDSRKEAHRWSELCLLQRCGEIQDLQRQVRIQLIPSQKDSSGKVIERPVFYVADFTYTRNGVLVVEDTKGFRTTDYILKRKMLLYLKGIMIHEV